MWLINQQCEANRAEVAPLCWQKLQQLRQRSSCWNLASREKRRDLALAAGIPRAYLSTWLPRDSHNGDEGYGIFPRDIPLANNVNVKIIPNPNLILYDIIGRCIHVLKCGDRCSGRRPPASGVWERVSHPSRMDLRRGCAHSEKIFRIFVGGNGALWYILRMYDLTIKHCQKQQKMCLCENMCPVFTFLSLKLFGSWII